MHNFGLFLLLVCQLIFSASDVTRLLSRRSSIVQAFAVPAQSQRLLSRHKTAQPDQSTIPANNEYFHSIFHFTDQSDNLTKNYK